MFTLGGTELLLVGVLALLLFGPEKVPQLARTLGRAMREFNKYKDIMESTFRTEMQAAEAAEAAKTASDSGVEPDDGTDGMKRAAAASREFAAEHGIEMPNASDLGIGATPVAAAGSSAEPIEPGGEAAPAGFDTGTAESAVSPDEAPELTARVTDEDEEEG